MKYNYFTIEDDIYPQCLKEISNPPLKLYYKGNLDLLKDERLIAVVGTRNPSSYGKLCCEYMVKKMTIANITIVSGFAKGIDTIAHKTSLLTGGKTIAVIASGLDIVYPASNLSLYREIEEKNDNNKYTQNQILILNSLSSEKNLDNILIETKIEQTEILAELMALEIMGVIKSIAGGRYKKIL